MAFGNYYGGFQNYYQPQDQLGQLRMQQYHQQPMLPQQMQPQQITDPIWVVGVEGANAFLMAPNTRATLFDSTAPVFYVKTTDGTGKPYPLEIFDYSRRGGEPTAVNAADYVTRKEFDELANAVKSLIPRKEDADA